MKISHVYVSIAAVEYAFALFDVSFGSILADVPGPIFVFLLGDVFE